uniref:Uncharacterized protein n=1 Tax=Arundo donax TaxID=35708 RepID=A0A0A9BL44_ARUDO
MFSCCHFCTLISNVISCYLTIWQKTYLVNSCPEIRKGMAR